MPCPLLFVVNRLPLDNIISSSNNDQPCLCPRRTDRGTPRHDSSAHTDVNETWRVAPTHSDPLRLAQRGPCEAAPATRARPRDRERGRRDSSWHGKGVKRCLPEFSEQLQHDRRLLESQGVTPVIMTRGWRLCLRALKRLRDVCDRLMWIRGKLEESEKQFCDSCFRGPVIEHGESC
ncbi:unnamed protein product [Lampetra fluviatilis]